MNVIELIEVLNTLPPMADVVLSGCDDCPAPYNILREITVDGDKGTVILYGEGYLDL
jgi:hypothetical protein